MSHSRSWVSHGVITGQVVRQIEEALTGRRRGLPPSLHIQIQENASGSRVPLASVLGVSHEIGRARTDALMLSLIMLSVRAEPRLDGVANLNVPPSREDGSRIA
jgi:hypothetical protein